jgi:hypothetical protein
MSQALAIRNPSDLESWGDRKLDNAIERGHATAGAHMRGYEEAATLTGVLLIERRRRLPSRGFAPWLAEHFGGARATAYRYVELGERYLASVSSARQIDPAPSSDELDGDDSEVVDAELVDDAPAPVPAAARANGNGASSTTRGSQLTDWLPDMLPGASTEGAFRQEVVAWCSRERALDGMLDNTGIELVPKSSDDRDALLDALAAVHQTATRLERQLRR